VLRYARRAQKPLSLILQGILWLFKSFPLFNKLEFIGMVLENFQNGYRYEVDEVTTKNMDLRRKVAKVGIGWA